MTSAITSADKEDALREAVNMGMGEAGAALAEALGTFVRLSVPTVAEVDDALPMLAAAPWHDRRVNASSQSFFGGLQGDAVAIFDEGAAMRVADLLGHEPGGGGHDAEPGRLADEILLEIGNLMAGACVNGLADRLNQLISFAPPVLIRERSPLVTVRAASAKRTLLIQIDFNIDDRGFESRVAILLPEIFSALDLALDRLLASLLAA